MFRSRGRTPRTAPGRRTGLFWLGPILAFASACSGRVPALGPGDYGIEVFNAGSGKIHQARVSFGGYRSRPVDSNPGRRTGESLIEEPVPEVALVEWRGPDGSEHRREVEVRRRMPQDFGGTIIFEIGDGDEVTVRFQPWLDPGF